MLLSDIFNYWMVCVICTTYNQSGYIIDALDGFVIQQTDFPFVCCIVDDASTDGEQEVIRKYVDENFDIQDISIAFDKDVDYGHVSFAQHKTNKNCYFAVIYLKENHYRKKSKKPYIKEWEDNAKYIALCEGDDYWTDPMKLQKQVDFLEGHPGFSLCCHPFKVYNQNDGTWDDRHIKDRLFEEHPSGFSFNNAQNMNGWFTVTLTMMYRKGLVVGSELSKYRYRCDVHQAYHLLQKGSGYCLPFIGGVYRKCDTGVYSSLDENETLKRWCRIRGELLRFNLLDKDLRDYVYNGIKKQLVNQKICREQFDVVRMVLKSFRKTEGLGMSFIVGKRIVRSYLKGLKR